MTDKEAKNRLTCLKLSYKIRIEEEDIEALEKGIKALENQKILQEELEKIKAKIKRAVSDFYMENGDIAYGLTVAECILDKHISELKGE